MPRMATFIATDRRLLLRLHSKAMHYFLDYQPASGLVLYIQPNH